ncbi:ABC transporter substrate-binding protein [Desulfovibrio sp. OttesenSCG-928-I05]|nr:ABC transporter substrate-binding protein [Desulfovibrio sp. OttesenSCG-928-I05]
MWKRLFLAIALVLCTSVAGHAADLRIGLSSFTTSVDPLFYVGGNNISMMRNMFDCLMNQDEKQQIKPGLAVSWKPLDDTTWELKMRTGVTFHDGSAFTSEDAAASIKRVALASVNSPSSLMAYVQDIESVETPDAETLIIKTKKPTPLLPNNLSRISILPAECAELTTNDLNAGKGVIGTGPFKFVSWAPDEHVTLAKNPDYWGGAPEWDTVVYRSLKSNSARVAAILAGDVDVIENVPSADNEQLRKNSKLRVISTPSNRVMYLHMDQDREVSPHAAGPDGKNPLLNPKVRRAISLSINRQALIDRVMDGQGGLAGQLVPEGYFGYSPDIKVDPYDPDQAKKLLAEAGYPNGFTLTSHASNDRYPNDAKVAQAVGQMLSRIGIKVSVETLPGSVYFSRASKLEFSFIMGGAAVETGEATGVLGPLLATYSQTTGQGNRGRYSNPAFDNALQTALVTVDDAAREKLLQQAMNIAMDDLGVIPLFFLSHNWAVRADLDIQPRTDGYTLAKFITTTK